MGAINRIKEALNDERFKYYTLGVVIGVGVMTILARKEVRGLRVTAANTYTKEDGASVILVKLANGRAVPLFKAGT